MHNIINLSDNPDIGTGGRNNGYLASSSHKRLGQSESSSVSAVKNGGYHHDHKENGHGVYMAVHGDSDSEDETTSAGHHHHRIQSRSRSTLKQKTKWRKVLVSFLAFCIPILFPTIHMYIFNNLWGHLKTPVDRKQCTCSCWDSIFKGPYESGIAGYKHVYFSSDGNTLKMWIITVMWVLFLYEAFKRLFLLLLNKKLRWTMGVLFLSSLHSHYYAWWGHWNYWNDEFYQMWYHQVFFTVTELISSIMVLSYLDLRRPVEPLPMLIVCTIAVFHTFCSGWDQFVFTVVQGQGQLHQILRDVTLMSTDIVHAGLSFFELRRISQRKGVSLFSILRQKTHFAIIVFLIASMYFFVLLFP